MKVLFVGNSHTYFNDMPRLFAQMCEEMTGVRPEVTMLAYSGRSLRWHREEHFSLRFALMYGGYDYCVVQQQAHPFPEESETRHDFGNISDMCSRAGTRAVIFMTWAEKAKPQNAARMTGFYRALASDTGALLAPVGELFESLRRDHPEIELYWMDGEHASVCGDYLAAACFAALLCPDGEIAKLSNRAIDFGVCFDGPDGVPVTVDDRPAAESFICAEHAEIIKAEVAKRIIA